jgi:glycosyltransferase involved in cell wall biosynthesis
MRILHCIATMGEGGAERQLVYLAEAQVRRGHEVHVAMLKDGPNAGRLHASGASVHLMRHSGNYDPRIVVRLARLIGKIRPDIVQNWLMQMDVIGGLAAELRRVRWIATERSSEGSYPPTVWTRLRTLLVRRAAAVVANSGGGARYWQARVPGVPIIVVPNAVPLATLRCAAAADAGGAKRPLIVYGGRLNPEKNVETILQAMTREPLREASLTICGIGRLHDSLERLARQLGIAERVTFAGFVGDLASWIKAADVVVSASFFEGHPNVVLEALACERPVVVSDIPAHREFLDDRTARFFDPHSADDAATALGEALRDRAGTAARVAAARDVITMLDPLRVAELYDDVSRRVAAAS